jgi:uncharacterized membrane protein YjjB (DUF3815 family)
MMITSPSNRRLAGRILIWLGVLAWAPFIYLAGNGQQVSIFPFLGAHLAGVLGGVWLRASADRMEGLDQQHARHGKWRRLLSRVMIYLGVLAWAPYFYLEKIVGLDVQIGPFLAAHLTGVLGGVALRASLEFERFNSSK